MPADGDYSMSYLSSLRAIATIFHVVAFGCTAFRVSYRWSIDKFWWDDFYALCAGCLDVVLLLMLWIQGYFVDDAERYGHRHVVLRIVVAYVQSIGFTCILWLARISIATSILRILPPTGLLRRLTIATSYLFLLACLGTITLKGWVCGHNKAWYHDWGIQCWLGKSYTIVKLTTDIVSSFLLVAIPLKVLWHCTLPKPERRMIRAVFASIFLTTAISVIHVVYLLARNKVLEIFTGHYEAAITVTLSNLLVITTYAFRIIRNIRTQRDSATIYHTSPPDIETQSVRRTSQLADGGSLVTGTNSGSLMPTFTDISDNSRGMISTRLVRDTCLRDDASERIQDSSVSARGSVDITDIESFLAEADPKPTSNGDGKKAGLPSGGGSKNGGCKFDYMMQTMKTSFTYTNWQPP